MLLLVIFVLVGLLFNGIVPIAADGPVSFQNLPLAEVLILKLDLLVPLLIEKCWQLPISKIHFLELGPLVLSDERLEIWVVYLLVNIFEPLLVYS